MERLTKRHGKHAVQIGGETRRHDVGWLRLAELEDMMEQSKLVEIVRCNDCKLQQNCRNAQYLGDKGYCSYAERKTEWID